MLDPSSKTPNIERSFYSAEDAIKECELITGQLPQGAVNELRYAAKHLIEFLSNNNKDTLTKFYRHCKRAEYDSNELSVVLLICKIENYIDSFNKNEDIANTVLQDNYRYILKSRRQITRLIDDARKANSNREDFLDEIQKTIPELQSNLAILEDSQPAITAAIKKEFKTNSYKLFAAFMTITGVVVAVLYNSCN